MEGKKRKIVFSVEDQLLLLDLILVEKEIIENKTTNKVTNDEKDKAWQKVTAKFNSSTLYPRSVDQLKSKFDNLKTKARKVAAAQINSSRGTGGGAPIKEFDPVIESTLKIMNLKTVVGLYSPFDSDAVENVELSILPAAPDPNNSLCCLIDDQTEPNCQNQSAGPVEITHDNDTDTPLINSLEEELKEGPHKKEPQNWSSYNSKKLKRPVTKKLRTQVRNPVSVAKENYYKIKKKTLENEETRKQEEHKIKKETLENEETRKHEEHTLRLELLKLQVLELQTKLNVEPPIVTHNEK